VTIITSALSKPISAQDRQRETLRLRTLSERGAKVFGEFAREVNKSNSPVPHIPLGSLKQG
jgi:hypothetical protein